MISRRKYSLDLLKETRCLGSKPVDSQMKANHQLHSLNGEQLEDVGRNQRLVSRLTISWLLCQLLPML